MNLKSLKWLVLILFFALTLINLHAEEEIVPTDANIVGHIIDKKTNEHLPYINVFLKGTTIGILSDATGHFYLKNLPEGKYILQVKGLGYRTQEREVVLIKGKTLEINFYLEEDVVALDQVVVSANRNETTRRLAPSLVNVLDTKILERANAVSLSQGLMFQPGVRVENNCQNCGFNQVRINGLDGRYSQILIDSRPVFSALNGVYGLEQIPSTMIERVEVVRGGGSALYGASAIAGTINIITKEPDRNSGFIAHNLTLIGGNRPDNASSLGASLVTDDNRAGIYVYGQARSRSAWDKDNDGFSEIGKVDGRTLGVHSYLKFNPYTKFTFEYHNQSEYRRGGDQLALPPHEVEVAETTDHLINGGSLKFDGFSKNFKHHLIAYASAQDIRRKSYYGGGKDPLAYGHTEGLTYVFGGQYVGDFDKCLFMPSQLMMGTEFLRDELDDAMPDHNHNIRQRINNPSFFAQNEWKNDKVSILFGGRLDKHSSIEKAIFSPRVNFRYNPVKDVNIRLSYASGFRAPQTFDEDLHVAVVQGESQIITNDPNLKEERSNSISGSIDLYHQFGNVLVNFLTEGFYTDLKDAFATVTGKTDGKGVIHKTRYNSGGARVYGMNLEGRVIYSCVNFQAGMTWQNSRYKNLEKWSEEAPTTDVMLRTPDLYGYFTASVNPYKPLTLALTGTYTGTMHVEHVAGYIAEDVVIKTPDFFDLGAKIAYDIPLFVSNKLQLNLGINNIFNSFQNDFDKGANRDSGYIYGPLLPRSFYMGCKLSF